MLSKANEKSKSDPNSNSGEREVEVGPIPMKISASNWRLFGKTHWNPFQRNPQEEKRKRVGERDGEENGHDNGEENDMRVREKMKR